GYIAEYIQLWEPQGSLGIRFSILGNRIITTLLHWKQLPKNPPPLQVAGVFKMLSRDVGKLTSGFI
ncbi:MAG: hypothetical protein K6T94_22865, partial [Paenibacillus sp.]|nr:hypothetical protein [Paenibacillus sp.]